MTARFARLAGIEKKAAAAGSLHGVHARVTGDTISRFDRTVNRLTNSTMGFRTFLLAIASALGVLSVVIWRLRTLGQKPDKDALKDLTAK